MDRCVRGCADRCQEQQAFFSQDRQRVVLFLPSSPTRFGGFSDHAQFFPFRRDRNSPSLYKCRVRPSGNFAKAEKLKIIGEYTEIEIGNGADALDRRPNLAAALKAARK